MYLIVALMFGILVGLSLHPFASSEWFQILNSHGFQVVGQVFLRLIFMTVVPLVFSALVLGVLELGSGAKLGRIASKTLFYTFIASGFSVIIGISLVQLLKPGVGISEILPVISDQSTNVANLQKNAAMAKSWADSFIELFPKNPIDTAARALSGEMLPLMVFALLFGYAMTQLRSRTQALEHVLQDVMDASMKMLDFAMIFAPFAVFSLVCSTVSKMGVDILISLMGYVVTVLLGLALQQFGVYSAMLAWIAKISPWEFYRKCRPVYLHAFSTASSNATLGLSLETAEHTLKLPPQISRFVLTVGATANQNGTALFEGITVLFLAQVYQVELSLAQQLQVVIMSILAGVGTAGVPGGSLPLIIILLQTLGIPSEGIGLILGVDRFLDMCRTTLNVSGDLVIAALVSAGAESQEAEVILDNS